MTIRDIIIRILKIGYRKVSGKQFLNPDCDTDRQSANDKIYDLLISERPCMISRFGTTEINCVNNYLCVVNKEKFILKVFNYITDHTHTPWWNTKHFEIMNIYSGIFPPCKDTSIKFSQRYLDDIPLIDLLGSFQYYEKFMPLSKHVIKVQLEMLYPFFVEKPWTRALAGKKVLVVHPFDSTIQNQYQKRTQLFDTEILPAFDLITFRAVQSVAGSPVSYSHWFEALAYMEHKISLIDFDICILGCGAYGLPLAAFVKKIGKKAIHIGGGTQLLFGIKGKRWEEQYSDIWHYRPGVDIDINYRQLFNEHWVYPGKEEKPKGADLVEGACYW